MGSHIMIVIARKLTEMEERRAGRGERLDDRLDGGLPPLSSSGSETQLAGMLTSAAGFVTTTLGI